MTAPVPFVGYTGFRHPGEVTDLLSPHVLNNAVHSTYGHRKILVGATVGDELDFESAHNILAQAPGAQCIRLLTVSSIYLTADRLADMEDVVVDGLLDLGQGNDPWSRRTCYTDVRQAWPNCRLFMPVTKAMAGGMGWNPRALAHALRRFTPLVTDFVFCTDGFPEDVFERYLATLYEHFHATHGVVLSGAYDVTTIRQIRPLWDDDRYPRLSLMMPLPPDSGNVLEQRRDILNHGFGITFRHRS